MLCAGLAERHRARAGLRIGKVDGVRSDVAPAQIEHLAAAAAGERQQADRGDGLGPARFMGVESAPEPGQLVCIEEPGDLFPRVLRDPGQGLEPRSRNPHSSARNIIERSISKARLAAPGLSLLASSNQAATMPHIRDHIEKGSEVHTDEHNSPLIKWLFPALTPR